MKINLFIASIASIALMVSCSQQGGNSDNSKKNNEIVVELKPSTEFQHCQQAKQSFSVSAKAGGTLQTVEGSKILVAPESFVRLDGTPVTGDVNVSYREINTPAEIVASGIPMQAFYKGKIGEFVSDGMFEIGATEAGKDVRIANGKSIKVFTKAKDQESDFKYWYFNKEKNNWEETGTRTELVNDKGIASAAFQMGIGEPQYSSSGFSSVFRFSSFDENVPVRTIPGKYDPKKVTLDINFDPKLYPELAAYSKIMWQYYGTDESRDPEYNRWLFQTKWQDVKLVPNPIKPMTYTLTIKTKDRVFETDVRPVVSGKDLEKAQAQYEEATKESLLQKKEKKDASAEAIEMNMYNSFTVQNMGVHNCDRFYGDPFAVTYTPTYSYENEVLEKDKKVYILTDKKSKVIQYTAASYQMTIRANTVDAIFTVLGNGAIAAASAVSISQIKSNGGGKINLIFEKIKTRITGMNSLVEAMNSL